ncbi:MAG: FAA hydrolase family protein [Hyphomicrobiales bacterium]|nr:MAG: FAA hydrolase family protein [Hyphomicrobiales bacterium]
MALLIAPPGKVIAVGLNYRDHARETNQKSPTTPMIFAHWTNALIGPGDPIILPPSEIDDRIDFEAELGVVIGSRARNVPAESALDVVSGYCCANDVSARKLQRYDSGGQHTMGKSLDTFDPIGALTPASEVPDPQRLRIRSILNGTVMQDSNTSEMIFSVAEVIAYLTRTVTLDPGDLIITGTPAGVGVFRKPKVLLQPGDEITIDIEGLAPLTNPVIAARD